MRSFGRQSRNGWTRSVLYGRGSRKRRGIGSRVRVLRAFYRIRRALHGTARGRGQFVLVVRYRASSYASASGVSISLIARGSARSRHVRQPFHTSVYEAEKTPFAGRVRGPAYVRPRSSWRSSGLSVLQRLLAITRHPLDDAPSAFLQTEKVEEKVCRTLICRLLVAWLHARKRRGQPCFAQPVDLVRDAKALRAFLFRA